jgi:hypothetical protein
LTLWSKVRDHGSLGEGIEEKTDTVGLLTAIVGERDSNGGVGLVDGIIGINRGEANKLVVTVDVRGCLNAVEVARHTGTINKERESGVKDNLLSSSLRSSSSGGDGVDDGVVVVEDPSIAVADTTVLGNTDSGCRVTRGFKRRNRASGPRGQRQRLQRRGWKHQWTHQSHSG